MNPVQDWKHDLNNMILFAFQPLIFFSCFGYLPVLRAASNTSKALEGVSNGIHKGSWGMKGPRNGKRESL